MLTTSIIGLLAGLTIVSALGIVAARYAARHPEGTPMGRHRTLDSASSASQPADNRNNSNSAEPSGNKGNPAAWGMVGGTGPGQGEPLSKAGR